MPLLRVYHILDILHILDDEISLLFYFLHVSYLQDTSIGDVLVNEGGNDVIDVLGHVEDSHI